jgi:hypothetical protein
MTVLKQWINIPHTSTLFLRVAGSSTAFDAQADLSVDGQPPHHFSHAELIAGTTVTLHSPHRYAFTIRLVFTGASTTVTLDAEARTPAGSLHGSAFRHSVIGDSGDLESIFIDALTKP